MKIEDKLNNEQKQKLKSLSGSTPSKKKKKRKRKPENVNWHEIMGVNRDTYKRVNGAIRRK